MSFSEIRHRVMGMQSSDCRQELADTLDALDQLEADFHLALLEIASATFDQKTLTNQVSREFDQMAARRGVEFRS